MYLLKKRSIFFLSLALTCLLFFNINAKKSKITEKSLDSFDALRGWNIIKPEETELKLSITTGFKQNSLCLDYDLGEKKLYVVISKGMSITLPQNYAFTFYIKGISQRNDFEFKLVDKNDNTYLKKLNNYKFKKDWEKLVFKKDDISFGWGPNPKLKLKEIKRIEFAISYKAGVKGKIYFDELSLVHLPTNMDTKQNNMKAISSSIQASDNWCRPHNAVDGDLSTRWSSQFSDPQWLEIDIGVERNISGLVLNWEQAYAKAYDIYLSLDRKKWKKVYEIDNGNGGIDEIYFKETKARFIKIFGRKRKTEYGYSLWEVSIKQPDEIPVVTASSMQKSNRAENILDGNIEKKWHSMIGGTQWVTIDFQGIKEFSELAIFWDKDYARTYEIQTSNDERIWDTAYIVDQGKGGTDRVYLRSNHAQFIKIICKKSNTRNGYGIKEIEIKPVSKEDVIPLQQYYEIVASQSPEGYYPRWLTKEQVFWTSIGVSNDEKEFILCEDGTIEPHKRGFIIMPFLYLDGKLITRNEARITQSLENKYLPIPSVKWDYQDVVLNLKMFAYGKLRRSIAYAWYTIKNNRSTRVNGKLFLAIRAFQLYPPWQGGGGISPIYSIKYKDYIINVNDKYKIYPLSKPDNFSVKSVDIDTPYPPEGDIISFIKQGALSKNSNVNVNHGNASAGIEFSYNLSPGESKNFFIAIPLYDKKPDLDIKMGQKEIEKDFNKMLVENINFWEEKVNKVEIDIPDKDMIETLKSNIAYTFITKDGPALQPGSRCYDKAWIRDGGIAAVTLLRMGFTKEAKEFIDWYTGYQFDNGRIVCVIDNKASDPFWENIDEYDCQGQYIYTIMQYYQFTKDKQYLQDKLPNIKKALDFMVELRSTRLTDEYKLSSEKKRFYGIIPNSYGMHYYWDDFWSLKGWKDAKAIYQILGKKDLAKWADTEYKALKKSVYDSINMTILSENIDYIPEYPEKANFWPSSIAGAVMYCEEMENLPQPQFKNTFDRYYKDFKSRLLPNATYRFTPYEVRIAEAFVYMNQKQRALELLQFMLKDRKPQGWNQFTEVVNSPERLPTIFGDMPHTWAGAEYINAVRSLFVYELNDKLILGHGIDEKWLSRKEGISVKNMPTHYGNISYTMKKIEDKILNIKISGKSSSPRYGFVFKVPWANSVKKIQLNGKKLSDFSNNEIVFYNLPVDLVVYYR